MSEQDDVPFGMHETNLAPWERPYAKRLDVCPTCNGNGCPYCDGPEADYHTMCIPCPDCQGKS